MKPDEVLLCQSSILRFWQELYSYLKTDIEIISPQPNTGINISELESRNIKSIKAKITASNLAPVCGDRPHIVFIRVNLGIANSRRLNDIHCKGSRLSGISKEVKPDKYWAENNHNRFMLDFPDATWEEQQDGIILFPGDTYTWTLDIPSADIPHIKFRVEATISQRHLMSHYKNITLPFR